MKAPKNFEAVFLAAAVLCTFTAYATAEVPASLRVPAAQVSVASHSASNVVVVKAKRLTAAEKQP
ncbi:MAG: hypothetical protein ACJ8GW_20075 [Massilia sp.]